MRITACLLAAIACGGPMRPRDVRASARGGAVEVSWRSTAAASRVQLADLDSGTPAGEPVVVRGSAADLFATVYPATLAHELQHLLNFAHRCVQRPCEGPEETWINEALSKVAEDLAGYGWNVAGGRAEGAAYLGHPGAELRGYDGRSLTRWEGDSIGNYQGAHSFLRLFTHRAGPDLAGRLPGRTGRSGGPEAWPGNSLA